MPARWSGLGAADTLGYRLPRNRTEFGPERLGVRLMGGGHREACRRRLAKFGAAGFRSPLTAFLVALSLIGQLFAEPYYQAASPSYSGEDKAAIAAELKAVFGEAAGFCAHIDDQGAPTKHGPAGHCCDQCTLCRFAAQAVAFVPPDTLALPQRLNDGRHTIGAAPDFGAFPTCPTRTNLARAPPFSV
jgi:hypothetical protein